MQNCGTIFSKNIKDIQINIHSFLLKLDIEKLVGKIADRIKVEEY